jgi:hypothetical protein
MAKTCFRSKGCDGGVWPCATDEAKALSRKARAALGNREDLGVVTGGENIDCTIIFLISVDFSAQVGEDSRVARIFPEKHVKSKERSIFFQDLTNY